MLNYVDLEMNLWTDEEHCYLTAYGRDEFNELDTKHYISVEIAESDYRIFTADDDAWYSEGDLEYNALLGTFILYQLNKKANENG